MKKATLLVATVCLVLPLVGCDLLGKLGLTSKYQVEMYVSLGTATTYPPGASSNLSDYWGKKVYFSVVGLDSNNSSINRYDSVALNWTGSDPSSGTQYATKTFSLLDSSNSYPGGNFKFQIYIDMNGDGTLDSGDIAMGSYSIIADTDNDPATAGVAISPSQYGSDITYNASDYSLTVNDPLALAGGFQWKIDAIHEGNLVLR